MSDIPDGDVLIHAGDATFNGTIEAIKTFNTQLSFLPHRIKLFIPGNHDWLFERDEQLARSLITNAIVLIDQEIKINGVKIYGSPWQPEFLNWAFNLPRGEKLKEKWAKIPIDTDILVTHGPPHKILDYTYDNREVGCEELGKRVDLVKPKYHVFGHIHYAYGEKYFNGTTFINASSCSEDYVIRNKAIEFEYPDGR